MAAQLKLYTRADCGLCEEMLATIVAAGKVLMDDIELIDVDSKAELRALYGNRVPVLLKGDIELAAGRISDQIVSQL